jgi:hypothetical protein
MKPTLWQTKNRGNLKDTWEAEVARRQSQPEYGDRVVRVCVKRHFDRIEFTVSDEGGGFDWQRYLEFDPLRLADPNGRGIATARALSFSSLEYVGNGSKVVATIAMPMQD